MNRENRGREDNSDGANMSLADDGAANQDGAQKGTAGETGKGQGPRGTS